MFKQVNVFKKTQDNWHGSYRLDGWHHGVEKQMLVTVTFCGNITAYDLTLPGTWRTCVWGNDDCGMEYDCDNEAECWTMFLQVIGLENVNRQALIELGFVYA